MPLTRGSRPISRALSAFTGGASESPREECGIIGVYLPGQRVANTPFFGLFALQHRGQESAGIASADGYGIHLRADMGLVTQVFRDADLEALPGHIAIGHTRYSTMGSSRKVNAQPLMAHGPRAVWRSATTAT